MDTTCKCGEELKNFELEGKDDSGPYSIVARAVTSHDVVLYTLDAVPAHDVYYVGESPDDDIEGEFWVLAATGECVEGTTAKP